jgi:protein required for attachment to host cells
MKRTWVLVANASKAICFERDEYSSDLRLVSEFEDPLGRSKGSELADDRAGYEPTGHGGAGSAFEPRTDVRTKQHDTFARRLGDFLNEAVAGHRCDELGIIASNPFLGQLKAHLNPESSKALSRTVPKDLTSYAGDELARRIHEALTPW